MIAPRNLCYTTLPANTLNQIPKPCPTAMKAILIPFIMLVCFRAFAEEKPAVPTAHTPRNIEGWTVRDCVKSHLASERSIMREA